MSKSTVILLVSAVLVGLLYALPPIFINQYFSVRGEPFVLAQLETYKDELTVYLPRAREIYDGHFPPRDLYFDEQRPTVLNPLPPLIFSAFIFLFNGNINAAYLGAQFLFAAIIFLLFYFLGRFLFRSRTWSYLFAFLGTLTPLSFIYYRWGLGGSSVLGDIGELGSLFVKQFVPLIRTPIHKLFLARMDDPLLTFPIFLSAILLFFLFWYKPSIKIAVLAAIPAGLLFYTYFHYWVYWTIAIGLFFVYTLLFAWRDKERLKSFIVLVAILFIIAVPYFINYFAVSNSGGEDYAFRLGLVQGRDLAIVKPYLDQFLGFIVLAMATYFLYRRRDRNKAILFPGLLAAGLIAWNIQLITGFAVVPGQVKKGIAVIIFIILFTLVYDIVKRIQIRWPKLKTTIAALLILLTIAVPLKKVVNVLAHRDPSSDVVSYYSFPKDIVDSWDWINNNLEHEPKIISSSLSTSLYLVSYTSARPFLATGFATPMPTDVLEERFLLSNKLFLIDSDTVRKRLLGDSFDCSEDCDEDTKINLNKTPRFLYVNYFAEREPLLNGRPIPQGRLDALVKRYDEISVDWKNIDANYVYYGPWERQFSTVRLFDDNNLELIYRNGSVEVYKIRRR